MDGTIVKSTRIGLGFATHSDAFQCGREAAQEAKNQLPDGPTPLVLIIGPGTVHFKDFVEGARLVLGEEGLVAIPTDRALSSETSLQGACFVVTIQTHGMRISIASDEVDMANLLRGSTALMSQFRKQRGNAARENTHRGGLIFSHQLPAGSGLVSLLNADMGLESWMVGASTVSEKEAPLICSNTTINKGLVGIEFLSALPWGIGSVEIGFFKNQADVLREALKTALREAVGQLQSHPACFGFVFFDLGKDSVAALPNDILAGAASILPYVPLLGLSTKQNFVRRPQRSVPKENDSIVVLLVPA